MKPEIIEAIKRSAAVPSMPAVVVRFLEVIQDPDFTYDDVVRVLSADPGTVSEILRLANSPLFGTRHDITSLKTALTLLGPKRTRSLVLGRYLVESMGGRDVDGLDMSYAWRRSLVCAVVASQLAGKQRPQVREETFISSLLADIGIPILAQAMTEKYWPISERYAPYGIPVTPEDEVRAVGVHHAEVSAMVLDFWKLPEVVVAAVRMHPSPPDAVAGSGGEAARIARFIHGADMISRLLCEIPDEASIEEQCRKAMEAADCELTMLLEVLPKVESEVNELAKLLRIDVVAGSVYELLARNVRELLAAPAVA